MAKDVIIKPADGTIKFAGATGSSCCGRWCYCCSIWLVGTTASEGYIVTTTSSAMCG